MKKQIPSVWYIVLFLSIAITSIISTFAFPKNLVPSEVRILLNLEQEEKMKQEVIGKISALKGSSDPKEFIISKNPKVEGGKYVPIGAECTAFDMNSEVVYVQYILGDYDYSITYLPDGTIHKLVENRKRIYRIIYSVSSAEEEVEVMHVSDITKEYHAGFLPFAFGAKE